LKLIGLGMSAAEIAKKTGYSLQSVYNLVSQHRHKDKEITRSKFTENEIGFIKDNYGKMTVVEMAEKMGRPSSSVQTKVAEFGLNKNKVKKEPKPVKKKEPKLEFDSLRRNPELQSLASDLVISCAKSKTPLKLSDWMNVLSLSAGEAKVLLVEIFNSQKRMFEELGRKGRIVWNGDVLSFY